jgi:hypothetical protein
MVIQTWNVRRSNKLQLVLIAYFLLFVGMIIYTIVYGIGNGYDADLESLGEISLVLLPWWILVVLAPPILIRTRRSAREICIDPITKRLGIEWFNREQGSEYPFNTLVMRSSHTLLGSRLIVLRKVHHGEGTYRYKKVMTVTAAFRSMSWRRDQLVEIEEALSRQGIVAG